MNMNEQVIIIGGGPCGLATAIALKRRGIDAAIIEKKNIVHSIYEYPVHQTFFSSADKLEIGGHPFPVVDRKPRRQEALVYYRKVAEAEKLRIYNYEEVQTIQEADNGYLVQTETLQGGVRKWKAPHVIIATGYYDNPNRMGVPGESLPHVKHYFEEAHPHFNQQVVIIGGRNSAVDAALALEQVNAQVTVLYRGQEYSKSIKPWILPDFQAMVRRGTARMEFEADVVRIEPDQVIYEQRGISHSVPADFVFAMTGYHPSRALFRQAGIAVDEESGRPSFDEETMETNRENIYIAGVIAAGDEANEIFIENGRFHGEKIAENIARKKATSF